MTHPAPDGLVSRESHSSRAGASSRIIFYIILSLISLLEEKRLYTCNPRRRSRSRTTSAHLNTPIDKFLTSSGLQKHARPTRPRISLLYPFPELSPNLGRRRRPTRPRISLLYRLYTGIFRHISRGLHHVLFSISKLASLIASLPHIPQLCTATVARRPVRSFERQRQAAQCVLSLGVLPLLLHVQEGTHAHIHE